MRSPASPASNVVVAQSTAGVAVGQYLPTVSAKRARATSVDAATPLCVGNLQHLSPTANGRSALSAGCFSKPPPISTRPSDDHHAHHHLRARGHSACSSSSTSTWPLAPPALAASLGRPAGWVLAVDAPLELPDTSRFPERFVVSHIIMSSGLLNLVLEGRGGEGPAVHQPLPLPLPSPLGRYPLMDPQVLGSADLEGEREYPGGWIAPSSSSSGSGGRVSSRRHRVGRMVDLSTQQAVVSTAGCLSNSSKVQSGPQPQVSVSLDRSGKADGSPRSTREQQQQQEKDTLGAGVSIASYKQQQQLHQQQVHQQQRLNEEAHQQQPLGSKARRQGGAGGTEVMASSESARRVRPQSSSGGEGGGAVPPLLLPRPATPSPAQLVEGFRPTRLVRRSGTLVLSRQHHQQVQQWRDGRASQTPTWAEHSHGTSKGSTASDARLNKRELDRQLQRDIPLGRRPSRPRAAGWDKAGVLDQLLGLLRATAAAAPPTLSRPPSLATGRSDPRGGSIPGAAARVKKEGEGGKDGAGGPSAALEEAATWAPLQPPTTHPGRSRTPHQTYPPASGAARLAQSADTTPYRSAQQHRTDHHPYTDSSRSTASRVTAPRSTSAPPGAPLGVQVRDLVREASRDAAVPAGSSSSSLDVLGAQSGRWATCDHRHPAQQQRMLLQGLRLPDPVLRPPHLNPDDSVATERAPRSRVPPPSTSAAATVVGVPIWAPSSWGTPSSPPRHTEGDTRGSVVRMGPPAGPHQELRGLQPWARAQLSPLEKSILTTTSLQELYDILDEHLDTLSPHAVVLSCRVLVGWLTTPFLPQGDRGRATFTGTAVSPQLPPWCSAGTKSVHCYSGVIDYYDAHPGAALRRCPPVGFPRQAMWPASPTRFANRFSPVEPLTAFASAYSPPGSGLSGMSPRGSRSGEWQSGDGPQSREAALSAVEAEDYRREVLSGARRCVSRLARRALEAVRQTSPYLLVGQVEPQTAAARRADAAVEELGSGEEGALAVLWAYGHLANVGNELDFDLVSDLGLALEKRLPFMALSPLRGPLDGRHKGSTRGRHQQHHQEGKGCLGNKAAPSSSSISVSLNGETNGGSIRNTPHLPFRGVMCQLWRAVLRWGAGNRYPLTDAVTDADTSKYGLKGLRVGWADPTAAQGLSRERAGGLQPLKLVSSESLHDIRQTSMSLLQPAAQYPHPQPHLPPASPPRDSSCPAISSWAMRALWAAQRGAPSLLPAVLLALASEPTEPPPTWPLQPPLRLPMDWQHPCSEGVRPPLQPPPPQNKQRQQSPSEGDVWPGLTWLSPSQLVSVLWACSRYADWLADRSSRTRKKKEQATGQGPLDSRRRAFRTALGGNLVVQARGTGGAVVGGQGAKEGSEAPGSGSVGMWPGVPRTRTRATAQLVSSVASSALRLLTSHLGDVDGWGGEVAGEAALSPVLTRLDLMASLEGATAVLEGPSCQQEIVHLAASLARHPSVRLQDLTRVIRLLGAGGEQPHIHTPPPGPHSQPSERIVDASEPRGQSTPKGNVVASGNIPSSPASFTFGRSSPLASALLAVESGVLGLLGGIPREEAEAMLRVRSMGSRGLRPRRGWYSSVLGLPPLATTQQLAEATRLQQQPPQYPPSQRHQQLETGLQRHEPPERGKQQRQRQRQGEPQKGGESVERVFAGGAVSRDGSRLCDPGVRWRLRLTRPHAHPLPLRLKVLHMNQPGATGTSGITTAPPTGQTVTGDSCSSSGSSSVKRSLELKLQHQQRLYDDEDVRRYGTSDLLELLIVLGSFSSPFTSELPTTAGSNLRGTPAPLPRPRPATVRCVLNALALRWLRSGVVQRDVATLIAALGRLGWRPRTALPVFLSAWRPFVVLAPYTISDAALAGMAQVLGCLTSHDVPYHPGGRAAAAAEGGLAWPMLRHFWVGLVALATSRLKGGGLKLLDGAVMHVATKQPPPPRIQPAAAAAAAPQEADVRVLIPNGFPRPTVSTSSSLWVSESTGVRSATGDIAGCQQEGLEARRWGSHLPLSVLSLVRLVWSSGRQGARVPELLGTACQLLLPLLPRMPPSCVGDLAWGLGQPRYSEPQVSEALLVLLRRWLKAAGEEEEQGGEVDGPRGRHDGRWTASCRVATALLRLRYLSPTAPELALLLGHITTRMKRQQHQKGDMEREWTQQGQQRLKPHSSPGTAPHGQLFPSSFGGLSNARQLRPQSPPACYPSHPQHKYHKLNSFMTHGNERGTAVVGDEVALTEGCELVNPRALAALLWAIHCEVGVLPANHTAKRSARRRLRRTAVRASATAAAVSSGGWGDAGMRSTWPPVVDNSPCGQERSPDPVPRVNVLTEQPKLFRTAAAFLAERVTDLSPSMLLQMIQIMASSCSAPCSTNPSSRAPLMEPSLLTAMGHLLERGPRWLLRSEAAALELLKAFHRLGWWPEGQVEEVCARLEELHQAPWRRSVTGH